ncbi:uncharacterized protein EV420DRAFT_141763 [Desarmillaria tabescens]|uniref:Uncharacterized protein n=1 Tax=Armillaria tabescens TaxID=1929756 RepID=A0AA39TK95_ARMTA|nr:uncharacterized protein EV420DRAFT_141763 [Desarmillaria tabescens]KAK0462027.1 hypothetical protein EV420DRAFT_141763 [Desarmillaria tabescens]
MYYDQSIAHRNGSYTSGNKDVQSQSYGARADDNIASHSDNSHSGGARTMKSEPYSHTGEGSSMNTGSVRYDNYVPGDDNEDSSSRDITSSRNSDYEYEQEQGAGRGAEAQSNDAEGNIPDTGNDDFGAGDIGQPISNGYDSGSAGWARENSVSDDSLGASRGPGYAGDSAPDTSAVGDPAASRGDTYDTGGADRNLDSESIAYSGVQSTSGDTGNSKNAGSYDESRSALASTFEEASTSDTGTKGEESTGSTGDHDPSIGASTTSDAPDADNGAYQGGSTRARRDDTKGGTDTDNYGRSPYDSTNGGRDTQTTSSDGQTLPSQRGSSTLDDDQQVQDATIRSSKADAGASTSDDRPSVSEGQTSSKDLQQNRDMTSDTSGSRSDNPSTNTKYGGSPYDTTGLGRDSRTTSSDSQPLSTVQRGSSAPCDNQQGRDAAAAKTPRKDSNIQSVSADTADHRSYDRGADTSETTTGNLFPFELPSSHCLQATLAIKAPKILVLSETVI